ncbi:MAG: hypothetical protein V3V10_08680 [Planctomycetota bacterium]
MTKLAYLLETETVLKLLELIYEKDPNRAIEEAVVVRTKQLGLMKFIGTFGEYDFDENYDYKKARKRKPID